jgi:hypothetical protein
MRSAPDIRQETHAFGPHEFAIETNDGAIPSTARLIRPEELMGCYGYDKEHIETLKALDWSKVRNQIQKLINKPSLGKGKTGRKRWHLILLGGPKATKIDNYGGGWREALVHG